MATFNGRGFSAGDAVPAGPVVPDVAKQQDMTRVPPTPGRCASTSRPRSSPCPTSRPSKNGYTVEAFLKLDEDCNGWSNALIRNASGTDIEPTLNDGDPADQSVTMYVDGAPILRDGYGPVGMAGEAFSWLLGTSAREGVEQDGLYGSIGEVRMVDHPIGPDQWLTARAASEDTGSSFGKVGLWALVAALVATIIAGLGGAFAPEMLRREGSRTLGRSPHVE